MEYRIDELIKYAKIHKLHTYWVFMYSRSKGKKGIEELENFLNWMKCRWANI